MAKIIDLDNCAVAGGGGGIDPVGLKNIANVKIDPATEPKQDSAIAELVAIKGHVDGLEALLTSLDGKDFATETTQLLVKAAIDGIKTATDQFNFVGGDLQVTLSGETLTINDAAIIAELTAIKGFVDGIEALLTSLDGKDYATQTTLAALLTAFNAEDFATETTLLTRLSKADFEARINTLGQKVMAASTPVVIASDQSAIDVNATVTSVSSGYEPADFVTFKSDTEVTLNDDVTYDTLHSVTGSGVLIGATFIVDNDQVECRILIDGNNVFEFDGQFLSEVVNKDANYDASGLFSSTNNGKRLYFTPPFPLRYDTSLNFAARKDGKKVKYQLYTYSVE